MQIPLGLLVFLTEDAVGRSELGHDQAASAKVADEAAENGVSHASHGSKDRGGRNGDVADGEAIRDRLQWLWLAGRTAHAKRDVRVVPELAHISVSYERSFPVLFYFAIQNKAPAGARAEDCSALTRVTSRERQVSPWRTCGGSARRGRRCP